MQNKQINRKDIGRRLLAYILALCIGFSPFLTNLEPVQAETITVTGPKVTVTLTATYRYLESRALAVTLYYKNNGGNHEETSNPTLNSFSWGASNFSTQSVTAYYVNGNGGTVPLTGANLTAAMSQAGFTTPTMTGFTEGSSATYNTSNCSGTTSVMLEASYIPSGYEFNFSDGSSIPVSEEISVQKSVSALADGVSSSYKVSQGGTSYKTVKRNYTFQYQLPSTTTQYYPIIEENDDLLKELGDPVVSWDEGIAATWGYTTSNTIPSDGTITDNALVSNNDTDLSTDGTEFDMVGWKTHNYRVKDSTNDATFTDTSRRIIVKSATAPNLDIFYADTTDAYGGEWVSQHASADADRQKKLDIKASTTDPGTTYDTTIFRGAAELGFASANTHTIEDYATESPTAAGEEFRAQLLGKGDHTIELSPKSGEKVVKIDSTIPTANITSSDSWATLNAASTDALSGVDKTYFKFINHGDAAPATTDSGWTAAGTGTPSGITKTGYYDVYTYAVDNATNKSSVSKVDDNVLIASTDPARITATYEDDENVTQNYTSGTWINKGVTVKVREPIDFDAIINWYGAIYEGATPTATPDQKATSPNSEVTHTYNTDTPTPGLTVRGYVVDATDTKLSGASPTMVLKIDKQLPTGDLKLNTITWGFDDLSTDQVSLSEIDSAKTTVAVMPTGSAPLASNYENISTAILPAAGYYDVWVIATDNAGNKSAPVKALENVSRSGKDTIDAEDFMRGINEGVLTASDAKALGLAEGSYYGGSAVAINDIVVDATELAAINAAISAGTKGQFPLTISTPATNPHINANNMPNTLPTTVTKTITVTLTDQTPSDPDDNIGRIDGNDFTQDNKDGARTADDQKATQTDDTSNIYIWILIAALAGTIALVTALARRKRNNA